MQALVTNTGAVPGMNISPEPRSQIEAQRMARMVPSPS